MEFIILLIIVGFVIGITIMIRKTRLQREVTQAEPPFEVPFPGPIGVGNNDFHDDEIQQFRKTGPGDMLNYLGMSDDRKIVVGVVTCKPDGYPDTWLEVRLDDGVWLSFEFGVNAQFTRWTEIPRGEVEFPKSDQLTLVYGGVTYKRNDLGTATYTAKGDTGLKPSGVLEFAEFVSPDGMQFISFEQFDGMDFSLSVGERLEPSGLDRYPGSNSPV